MPDLGQAQSPARPRDRQKVARLGGPGLFFGGSRGRSAAHTTASRARAQSTSVTGRYQLCALRHDPALLLSTDGMRVAQLAAHFGCCQATGRRWQYQFAAAGLKSPRHQRRNLRPHAILPNPLLECGSSNAIISLVDKVLAKIRRNPRNVRFGDLRKVCDHYFGQP